MISKFISYPPNILVTYKGSIFIHNNQLFPSNKHTRNVSEATKLLLVSQ